MIIEIPNENSIVKWKNDDKDEWKVAEISDLIKAHEEITDGDLISRKSLKKEISRLVVGGENAIKDAGYGNFWINGLHSAFRCIDCMKSIGEEYE